MVSFCHSLFLFSAPCFLLTFSTPAWLLHSLWSLWGCYLFCHGASPIAVALLPFLGIYCPFLNTFSPRPHHLGWGAQPCPAMGGWLEPLEPAVSNTGQLQPFLTETACNPPPTVKHFPLMPNKGSQNNAPQILANNLRHSLVVKTTPA